MFSKILINGRTLSRILGVRYYARNQNPFTKTWNILSNDMPTFISKKKKPIVYPEHADVVIIGGGFIGSAVAYWLKTRAGEGLSIVVFEKDFTYKGSQTNVSLGTLNQHFSLPENINLSKYSVDFLRNIKNNLGNDVNIQYVPTGSLVLASEQYAQKLEENVTLLNELGVRNLLLTAAEIKNRFPWINTEDVKLGCMAMEAEGTFNSWALLKGLIQKSIELGTKYVNAEVIGFEFEKQQDVLMEGVSPGQFERISKVVYKTPDNEEHAVKFAICVLAAGDKSGQIGKLAGVGTGDGLLGVPLPIEKREYQIYSVPEKGTALGLSTPIVMDTTGLWLMRNGLENNLLCGNTPLMNDDTKISESDYYNNIIKPSLLNRIPSCKDTEINQLSTAMHDCNIYDNTGVIGPHPYHNNFYIAAGFGKLGCQHAPGIGRAVAELVIDSRYVAIDFTRFGFDRFLLNERLVEFNVY